MLARGINSDPTLWLDGGRPPPWHVFRNNMSSTHSIIWPIKPHQIKVNIRVCITSVIELAEENELEPVHLDPAPELDLDLNPER